MGLLRFLLAVAVVLWHCPAGWIPRFIHPALAVQCFYAVSGFLIQMVIIEKYSRAAHWRRSFYASRALRIYPLYWLVLLATLFVFHGYRQGLFMWQQSLYWPLFVLIANNITLLGQDLLHHVHYITDTRSFELLDLPGMGAPRDGIAFMFLPQSWTLALELYFYLLAPFILLRPNKWLVTIIIGSFLLRSILGQYLYLNGWTYSIFPEEIGIFLLGSMAYRAYKATLGQPMDEQGTRAARQLCILLLAMLCFILFYMDLNFLGPDGWEQSPFGVSKGYMALLLIFVAILPAAFFVSRFSRLDRWIGELSYPIYITHFFLLSAFDHYRWVTPEFISLGVLASTISISVITLYAIDRPFDRLRHRLFTPSSVYTAEKVKETPMAHVSGSAFPS